MVRNETMTRNLRDLKEDHDLREIVEADLGPSPLRGGAARLWRCPFHDEQRGFSLVVWADHWRCFGKCQVGGDVFDWLARYRGLTLAESCALLDGGAPATPSRSHRTQAPVRLSDGAPPVDAWQHAAWKVVREAMDALWSTAGSRARDYLRRRGLTDETIWRARLGLVAGRPTDWRTIRGLHVPCGILIPWVAGDALWALKVRRASGGHKYQQVRGSSAAGLYNADRLADHAVALFTEGEFDALLADQEAGDLVGVVTLGGAGGRLHRRWAELLVACRAILVAYDNDDAGRKGAARLQALTRRVHVMHVPFGKDITEFVMQGGDVKSWLESNLHA
jgi:DNA primase